MSGDQVCSLLEENVYEMATQVISLPLESHLSGHFTAPGQEFGSHLNLKIGLPLKIIPFCFLPQILKQFLLQLQFLLNQLLLRE
jgi:hypothetical protein